MLGWLKRWITRQIAKRVREIRVKEDGKEYVIRFPKTKPVKKRRVR